jgi:hypothetical protein
MTPQKHYCCRLCGRVLHAWLSMPGEPNGAMLLHHLSYQHPDQVGAYLDRMHRTEDITPVLMEAFAVVEEPT